MSADFNDAGYYSPPERGKSGGSKIWMFLGIGCGVSLLLCCGGGAAVFYVIKGAVQATQVAAEVDAHAGEIADFDRPAGFAPQSAFTMKVPFTGQRIMTMVAYTAPEDQGGVFLMQAGQFGDGSGDSMRRQMSQSMEGQGQQMKSLTVLSSRDLDLEIRGQAANFKIQKTEDPSKRQFIQVVGTFQGKQGAAILVGQLNADKFTEEDAEKLARSIK